MLVRVVAEIDPRPIDDNHAAMAAWGLVHGLAHLIVEGLFPVTQATAEAEKILSADAAGFQADLVQLERLHHG